MSSPVSPLYSDRLRTALQRVGLASFKALSRAAGVSDWQVEQLRRGQAAQLRAAALVQLSQTLQMSLPELLANFSDLPIASPPPNPYPPLPTSHSPLPTPHSLEQLKQEYQRLQQQLDQQQQTLQQDFQQASLQILESWLIQFPTAAYAAQQNPQVPATRLLPLLRPIEQLVKQWGVEAIATVGSEVPYNPQEHQLMDGTAQPGDLVKIRYTGYRQGEKLLYRAKVSPVISSATQPPAS